MKSLLESFSLICLLTIVACGTKDAPKTVATTEAVAATEAVKPVKEVAPVKTVQIKEATTVTETTPSPRRTATTAATPPKIVEKQGTTNEATAKATANKKTSAVKKVAIKNPTPSKKEVVEQTTTNAKVKIAGAKEVLTSAATTVKEKAKVKIEGAKEVVTTATTSVKKTSPKIVETANEKIQETKNKLPAKKEVVNLNVTVDHSAWDKLLRKYVSAAGKVNYKGIKANKTALDAYLKALDVPFKDSWSRSEKMAYWINAYNAFTVKLIVDNYPLKSIMDLHGGKPWDQSWIKLGGKTYSLNDIEHKILRPQFKDARIHFAVNCAASSCPPLLNQAWTAKNLNSNLERQAKQFINNAKYNSVASDKLTISKIFEWYQEDFGDLVNYLNKYAGTKIKVGPKVNFKEYDWALNE